MNGEELKAQKQEKELRLAHALKTEKWPAKSPKGLYTRDSLLHGKLIDGGTVLRGGSVNPPIRFGWIVIHGRRRFLRAVDFAAVDFLAGALRAGDFAAVDSPPDDLPAGESSPDPF